LSHNCQDDFLLLFVTLSVSRKTNFHCPACIVLLTCNGCPKSVIVLLEMCHSFLTVADCELPQLLFVLLTTVQINRRGILPTIVLPTTIVPVHNIDLLCLVCTTLRKYTKSILSALYVHFNLFTQQIINGKNVSLSMHSHFQFLNPSIFNHLFLHAIHKYGFLTGFEYGSCKYKHNFKAIHNQDQT
jgi:hypothetical protein